MSTRASKAAGLCFFVLLSACVTTTVETFQNPQFANVQFNKIAVIADTQDLEWRGPLEESLAAKITELGGNASSTMSIIPPTSTMTTDEALQKLADADYDALVVITIGDAGKREEWVPQTTTTTGTMAGSSGGGVGTIAGTSTTTTTGGYTSTTLWAKMHTAVIDISSGQKAWIASSTSEGQMGLENFDDVRIAYAAKIASKMAEAKLW